MIDDQDECMKDVQDDVKTTGILERDGISHKYEGLDGV